MTATISPSSIIAIIKDQVYNANSSHPFFKQLLEAVKERDEDKFLEYFNKDIKEELVKTGKIHIEGDTLYFNGIELHNSLTTRIIEMFKGGFPIDHMMTFLENLMKNPSSSSVNELYTFLEHKNLPITDDGCFLSYKAVLTYNGEPFVDTNGRDVVNGCFVDKYSRRIRNNIGDVLEMPRNQVDDNRNVGCSTGYHVGALEYSGPNGWYSDNRTTTLIVKVNPADVVSVPADINCTKLRACKYEVVGVYKAPLNKPVYEEEDELDWDDDFDTDIGYF